MENTKCRILVGTMPFVSQLQTIPKTTVIDLCNSSLTCHKYWLGESNRAHCEKYQLNWLIQAQCKQWRTLQMKWLIFYYISNHETLKHYDFYKFLDKINTNIFPLKQFKNNNSTYFCFTIYLLVLALIYQIFRMCLTRHKQFFLRIIICCNQIIYMRYRAMV